MKEVLRELDEAKVTRDDVISQSKDSEKKIQTLEAEVLHLTEVCMSVCAKKPHPIEILRYLTFIFNQTFLSA